jgi:hypothetical protein
MKYDERFNLLFTFLMLFYDWFTFALVGVSVPCSNIVNQRCCFFSIQPHFYTKLVETSRMF